MTEQNFPQMRHAMVASQLRTTGVNDPRVVAAMGAVPRERFVPDERGATRLCRRRDPAAPVAARSTRRWCSANCSPKPIRGRASACS